MHKHYTVDEWVAWAAAHPTALPYVAVSAGTSEDDFQKISAILAAVAVEFICLDVANGYSEFVSFSLLLPFLQWKLILIRNPLVRFSSPSCPRSFPNSHHHCW